MGTQADTTIYGAEYRFTENGHYTVLILGQNDLGGFAGQAQLRLNWTAGKTGDFTGDGQIGFEDFLLFAQHFGFQKGDLNWSSKYGLNGDGEVAFGDFILFATVFGKKPVPTGSR